MNIQAIQDYLHELQNQYHSGHAREHAYRPALERLMSSFEDVRAVNDPARSENGNPDFVFLKASNNDIILGYAEAKDITVSVDKTLKTEQLRRYAGYEKLFLTNYLDFVFLQNGEEYERITIGKIQNNTIVTDDSQFTRLEHELKAFLEKSPETTKSGKRLSIIMGGKARRIRDNVREYLKLEDDKNKELENIYKLMRQLLVHDLTKEKFADMYAQTLVYGLFAARYNDDTPADFSRREAVENVPKSNPFLRKFFDHIAGSDFDSRLKHIVDELCDVFSVSDVEMLIHKHLRLFEVGDEKDPIIHFYEDFLKEYDPDERKKMGAYYTPVPVVRFIVRQVDKIIKEEFGLSKGLAETSKITKEVDHGQLLQIRNKKTGRLEKTTKQQKEFHRVQVLDPAVGTATFLNETIKFIHQGFKGQEGQWPSYVNEDLVPRLNGFELMVAPYTVAHLKLGITLRESGVKEVKDRLGIYLTNTLEEGVPRQADIFNHLGLAGAVTEEAQKAAEIKDERPIMVIMGNPPYSVSSNNKSDYIQSLIKDYKKNLNERKINLDDDYIKFIRFSEEMINKNGSGVVAMITNNSYIDGITHRQMRKHLLETFDKIYVLDLHGSTTKGELTPDGKVDNNVFDIKTGVSIILMIKTGNEQQEFAEVYHADLWGKRASKFETLNDDTIEFARLSSTEPYYFFVPKDTSSLIEYNNGVTLGELFVTKSSPFRSGQDDVQVTWDRDGIENVVNDLIRLPEQEYRNKYNLKDGRNHNYEGMKADVAEGFNEQRLAKIIYRPFDIRWTYYSKKSSSFAARPRNSTMNNFVFKRNIGLLFTRINRQLSTGYFFLFEGMPDKRVIENLADEHVLDNGLDSVLAAPLYLYHEDGTRTPNFDPDELSALTHNLTAKPSPEDILDYIYAVLHSPKYREKYKEFLKIDFPRVPAPKNDAEFVNFVKYGKELRNLHLIKSPQLDSFDTTFSISGDNIVSELRYFSEGIQTEVAGKPNEQTVYKKGSVYINKTQYFGNVPKNAWDFYIGGYQPAQKWLKDRKGRNLTSDDINHYQKIIKILLETDRIMKEIDRS